MVLFPQPQGLKQHSQQLEAAKAEVAHHMAGIQTELLLAAKQCDRRQRDGNSFYEGIFVEYTSCRFTSTCDETPGVCGLLQKLEGELPSGSSIISSSIRCNSSGAAAFPGRLRLLCRLAETKEENPRCSWVDAEENIMSDGQEIFFIIDVLDPSFISEVELSGGPGSLLWLEATLARLGDGSLGGRTAAGSSLKLLQPPRASRFRHPGSEAWGKPWIQLAMTVGNITEDLCTVEDFPQELANSLHNLDSAKEALRFISEANRFAQS